MKVAKFIGKFHVTGHHYSLLTPESVQITITPYDQFYLVSVFDQTSNGTVLTFQRYNPDGKSNDFKLGQIVEVRDQQGKVVSRYLQSPSNKDNAVTSWFVSQLNKKGYVTQYTSSRVESGFNIDTVGASTLGVVNPNQQPEIGQKTVTRVSKFPWE